jgi:proteasome lid subunit RPN8/RPN11
MKFFIPKRILEEMVNHARKEFPFEACGILAGRNGEVSKLYPLQNEERSEISYFASPREQIRAFKKMREEGLELVGIYHSHPNSPARPSQRDVELAFYPEAVYLIVSLKSPDIPEVKAYKLTKEKIEEVEIVLKEDSDAYTGIY